MQCCRCSAQEAPLKTPEEIRSTFRSRLSALGASQAEFCSIADVTTAQLSRFINGAKATDLASVQHMDRTLVRLERLAARVFPVPIDFANSDAVRRLLGQGRDIRVLVDGMDSVSRSCMVSGGLHALAGWSPTLEAV
jgi:hypothetical protein